MPRQLSHRRNGLASMSHSTETSRIVTGQEYLRSMRIRMEEFGGVTTHGLASDWRCLPHKRRHVCPGLKSNGIHNFESGLGGNVNIRVSHGQQDISIEELAEDLVDHLWEKKRKCY